MTSATHSPAPVNFLQFPLGAFVSACRDAVVLVNAQQRLVTVNEAAAQLFGCEQQALLGRDLSCLIPDRPPAAIGLQLQAFADAPQGEHRGLKQQPVQALRANGQAFAVEVTVSRLDGVLDGQTGPLFVLLLRDLGSDRDLRTELAKFTTQLRKVLDQMPVPIWTVEAGQLVYANRAAADLFGVPVHTQLLGRSVHQLLQLSGPITLQAHLDRAQAPDAKPELANATALRPDGQTRQVEVAAIALPDHGQTVLQMVTINISANRALSLEQSRLRQELRRLAANVVVAREEERRRIARELHDDLGQRLTVLKMEIASLRQQDPSRDSGDRIGGMLEMVDSSVSALRRLATDLRPLMLDDLGLNAAIESLARETADRMDMEVTVRLSAEDLPLAPGADIALYRMVQEALANVGRHAGATDVRIELCRRDNELVLTVQDNGKGFPERSIAREGRFGLLGMRERALMMGGRLEIDNPPDGGGRVTVHLPLQPNPGPAPAPP